MGSSWRYRHVAILRRVFSQARLYVFHGLAHKFLTGLHFAFDGRASEFHGLTREWQTTGSHQSKQKNKSAQLAPPTFSQHFPTQVSPHYPQLDPIYYEPTHVFKTRIVGADWLGE